APACAAGASGRTSTSTFRPSDTAQVFHPEHLTRVGSYYVPPDRLVKTFEELLADYERERSDPAWQPVHLGFGAIDAEIRGISPGQVLGVAARTAVGKTWLVESIAHNF